MGTSPNRGLGYQVTDIHKISLRESGYVYLDVTSGLNRRFPGHSLSGHGTVFEPHHKTERRPHAVAKEF